MTEQKCNGLPFLTFSDTIHCGTAYQATLKYPVIILSRFPLGNGANTLPKFVYTASNLIVQDAALRTDCLLVQMTILR